MEEFIKLVENMRNKQKDYFRMRDQRSLREAKEAEQKVDWVIKEIKSKGQPRQSELF